MIQCHTNILVALFGNTQLKNEKNNIKTKLKSFAILLLYRRWTIWWMQFDPGLKFCSDCFNSWHGGFVRTSYVCRLHTKFHTFVNPYNYPKTLTKRSVNILRKSLWNLPRIYVPFPYRPQLKVFNYFWTIHLKNITCTRIHVVRENAL